MICITVINFRITTVSLYTENMDAHFSSCNSRNGPLVVNAVSSTSFVYKITAVLSLSGLNKIAPSHPLKTSNGKCTSCCILSGHLMLGVNDDQFVTNVNLEPNIPQQPGILLILRLPSPLPSCCKRCPAL